MITTATEIKYVENSFEVINGIKLDDLEKIVKTEFAQGLPSDIEFNPY